MTKPTLGVIGGSGLYQLAGLTDVHELRVDTPFGAPSDAIVKGRLGDTTLLFVPRHGRGHVHSPSHVPYRANVYALKALGATHVVSVSAVGSLVDAIAPGHLVVPSQFIDRTHGRAATFFDQGVVAHVAMGDPVCAIMANAVAEAARANGATVHTDKTYLCIEGPRFSTRAESHSWIASGAHIVGMTNAPEVFLAREAELPYATLALATDYDSWKPHGNVAVEEILAVLKHNIALAQAAIATLAASLPDVSRSAARSALTHAVMTAPDHITAEARIRYGLLLARALDG
ncbi:MAG: S-methyl-5'-thioadenosine phosphorylase [Myxococcales bacterium]|nr:S-methyl-5'-thioadenosine phosphorylase [Myxococcales bacterium]